MKLEDYLKMMHVEYYNNNGFFMVTIYNANYNAEKMHRKFIILS